MIFKVILLLGIVCVNDGANIAFFFGISMYSHRIAAFPLAGALADRGHNITFINSFLPKIPNPKITEFYPKELRDKIDVLFDKTNMLNIRVEKGIDGVQDLMKEVPAMTLKVCDDFLQHPETQEWLKKSNFDLFIINNLMNDCGFGVAYKFKAKTIIFATSHPFGWLYDEFGIVPESSWTPDIFHAYQSPMSLWERTVSTILPMFIHYKKQSDIYPKLDNVFKERIDPSIPTIAELERYTSLIFTNSHFSEELARSLPPLIVPVGGIHCEDSTQTLSKDLEKFIIESGDLGFVYISFGSTAKISTAPIEFRNIFMHAMGNSSTRFVWKYDGKRPADMPSNVFTDTWMPQQAVLAHPKIQGFLTHGGLLGIQEAVWHGVPLLIVPLFAEQDYNALRIEKTQRGIMLDPNKLTQAQLKDDFEKILKNPKYKKNMAKVSREFKDRPAKPVETAVWWTEYVLRHDDTASMKPLGIQQTWYERRLLDVWATVFTTLLAAILLILYILKKIIALLFKSKVPSPSMKSKAKRN